ncbi:MAG: hypothetical protein NWQ45_07585, partial [Congregibacter sp.]|nr:hypothetical protein [Congregibacter sp.]
MPVTALRLSLTLILATLLSLFAALVTFRVSPDLTLRAIEAATARLSPYELKLLKPELRWSPFAFRADLLLLNYRDQSGPPLVSLQSVDFDMPFGQLLFGDITGGHLKAGNITYYLDAQSSDEPIDFEALLAPLGRLPQQIDIASVHLISRSSNVWIFPLHDVRASRNAQGSMDVTAQANIAQRDVLLNARANWLELKGNHRLDLSAVISGLQEDSQLNATGYLDATGAALSYKMSVQGRYESVSDFLQALDDNAYPFAGNLSVAGTLQGDLDGYTLSLDEIGLRDGDAYAFSASGIITQRGSDAVSLDLNARGTARQLDGILPLEGALADMLERTELEMTVAGTLDSPILQSAALVLYGPGDTRLSLSSQSQTLTLADLQALSPRQTIHANIDAQIGNLAALLPVSTLESDTFLQSQIAGVSASFTGEAHGLLDELRVDINDLTVRHSQYLLSAKTQLLWRQDVLSAPTLELTLDDAGGADSDRAGTLRAKGSIADLRACGGRLCKNI